LLDFEVRLLVVQDVLRRLRGLYLDFRDNGLGLLLLFVVGVRAVDEKVVVGDFPNEDGLHWFGGFLFLRGFDDGSFVFDRLYFLLLLNLNFRNLRSFTALLELSELPAAKFGVLLDQLHEVFGRLPEYKSKLPATPLNPFVSQLAGLGLSIVLLGVYFLQFVEVLLRVLLDKLPVVFRITTEDLAELKCALGGETEDSPSLPVPSVVVAAVVCALSTRAFPAKILRGAYFKWLLDLNEVVRVIDVGFTLLAEVEVGTFVALVPDTSDRVLSTAIAPDVLMNYYFGD
jgi:hypothetical protein